MITCIPSLLFIGTFILKVAKNQFQHLKETFLLEEYSHYKTLSLNRNVMVQYQAEIIAEKDSVIFVT